MSKLLVTIVTTVLVAVLASPRTIEGTQAASVIQNSQLAAESQTLSAAASELRKQSSLIPSQPKQTWIKKWAALGDSYAAGIGTDTVLDGTEDARCSRYNGSYPYLLNSEERLGNISAPDFQFLACSGATSNEIITKQVPSLNSSLQVITLSAGGNDVSIVDVLKACVYAYYPIGSCDSVLQTTKDKICKELPENIENLLNAVKPKLSEDGTIYYTGYARFFSTETHECDNVTWAFVSSVYKKPYLTKANRQAMNDLVDATNAVIQNAVIQAGKQVVFIDYNPQVSELEGRFCEKGVLEPDPNREGLLFYEWSTADDPPSSNRETLKPNNGLAMEWDHGAMRIDGIGPVMPNSKAKNDPIEAMDSSYFLTDKQLRVFHPQPMGHVLIANLVFDKIVAQREKLLQGAVTRHFAKGRWKLRDMILQSFLLAQTPSPSYEE